jgi:hypothetical protein
MKQVHHLPTSQWAEDAFEERRLSCLMGVPAQAEGGGGNNCFRAVGHLQRLKDGGDVNFHRRLCKLEHAMVG